MRLQIHIEIFISQTYSNSALLMGLIAGNHNISIVRTLEDDNWQTIRLFSRQITLHTTAGRNKMRKVLDSIELSGVPVT